MESSTKKKIAGGAGGIIVLFIVVRFLLDVLGFLDMLESRREDSGMIGDLVRSLISVPNGAILLLMLLGLFSLFIYERYRFEQLEMEAAGKKKSRDERFADTLRGLNSECLHDILNDPILKEPMTAEQRQGWMGKIDQWSDRLKEAMRQHGCTETGQDWIDVWELNSITDKVQAHVHDLSINLRANMEHKRRMRVKKVIKRYSGESTPSGSGK